MSEYKGDLERDLLIPLGRALIGGVLVAVGLLTIAILAGWVKPWVWFFAGWAFAALFEWFRHTGKTTKTLERWLGVDIDQDGRIGDETVIIEPAPVTRIEIVGDNGRWGEIIDLPLPPELTVETAKLLTSGADFSHASLSGPNKILSRSQWEAFRDELIRKGYARWVNPYAHNQGAILTRKGEAAIHGYASMVDVHGFQE